MRIIVTFDDTKERIEGDAPIFDGRVDYQKGCDKRLAAIGFWVDNWKYAGHCGPNKKSRVFIPWGAALFIEEVPKCR